ncbi:MAG: hypothetical protein ACON5K_09305 [Bacteroidia bacterium]
MIGVKSQMTLEEKTNVKPFINKRNKILAILGTCFGLLTYIGIPILDLIFSYAFGTCFGLIGVNLIFEYTNSKKSKED